MFQLSLVCVVLCYMASASAAPIDVSDVKYYVYTAQNPDDAYEHSLLKGIGKIDPTRPVKILCHGFEDTSNSEWIINTKNSFMTKGYSNVIAVDWSVHGYGAYSESTKRAPAIGQHIADMVMELSASSGIALNNFHLIGHSLGSHISGFAGKKILASTGQKVGRITGLDPAGPSYNGNNAADRLSADDATFVDAIHTDSLIFGYKKSIGHVDFWPNGGSGQAGCSVLSNCSHLRAPVYFYESINSGEFPAWECASKSNFNNGKCFENTRAVMGDDCPTSTRGDFYLNTNKITPFGIISY